MSEHSKEELKILNQALFAIFLAADFAYFLSIINTEFPWFSLAGASIGLAIIVFCWSGAKYMLFNIFLLIVTAFLLLVYNWGSLFGTH